MPSPGSSDAERAIPGPHRALQRQIEPRGALPAVNAAPGPPRQRHREKARPVTRGLHRAGRLSASVGLRGVWVSRVQLRPIERFPSWTVSTVARTLLAPVSQAGGVDRDAAPKVTSLERGDTEVGAGVATLFAAHGLLGRTSFRTQ